MSNYCFSTIKQTILCIFHAVVSEERRIVSVWNNIPVSGSNCLCETLFPGQQRLVLRVAFLSAAKLRDLQTKS